MRRCKGIVADGVHLIADGAPITAEDGGMTGPRGRRPRPSELIINELCWILLLELERVNFLKVTAHAPMLCLHLL